MEAVETFVRGGTSQSSSIEKGAVETFLASCPLPLLFSMMGSVEASSSAESTLLLALTRVYTSPKGVDCLRETTAAFVLGLAPSTSVRVRESSAKVLARLAPLPNAATAILASAELTAALLDAVGGDDVSTARFASDALANAFTATTEPSSSSSSSSFSGSSGGGEGEGGAGALLVGQVASAVAARTQGQDQGQGSGSSSVACVRFLELSVRFACTSPQSFAYSADSGALQGLSALIKRKDPLLQLTVMDLIGRRLCSDPSHVAFLFKAGLAEWLLSLATGDGTGPDALLGGDALRVVSAMFVTAFASSTPTPTPPEAAAASEAVPAAAEASSNNDNAAAVAAAAAAAAAASASAELEELLGRQPDLLKRFLNAACAFGDDASSEAKNMAAIDAVSHFAASSPSNLALVLADASVCRSWLTLPSRVMHKASVLHSLAHALTVGSCLGSRSSTGEGPGDDPEDTRRFLPQPPVVDGNPAFALPPPNHLLNAEEELSSQPMAAAAAAARSRGDDGTGNAMVDESSELSSSESLGEALFVEFGHCNGYEGKGQVVGLLMLMLRQPISEVRHGAFDVLVAVASSAWGVAACGEFAGFWNFVENRHTEVTKEGKDWKFLLIQTMASNLAQRTAEAKPSDPRRLASLRLMVDEGPYYMPYTPQGPEVL
mmetsp:Transcript_8129/g.13695  ORF Transcript_8129/g.13695 Transcript_8129/m.13695 type:complete len:662 (+) Transcript_8129:59-2044(+)